MHLYGIPWSHKIWCKPISSWAQAPPSGTFWSPRELRNLMGKVPFLFPWLSQQRPCLCILNCLLTRLSDSHNKRHSSNYYLNSSAKTLPWPKTHSPYLSHPPTLKPTIILLDSYSGLPSFLFGTADIPVDFGSIWLVPLGRSFEEWCVTGDEQQIGIVP